MDFGKLPSVDHLRFELPENDSRTVCLLSNNNKTTPRIYTGAPVWSCKEWVGKIYPQKTPATKFLYLYSRKFNSIELNSTFYRLPDISLVKNWKDTTPEGFKFSPKVYQFVSHQNDVSTSIQLFKQFQATVSHFEDRLGLCFLQLPPDFSIQKIGTLELLLKNRLPTISLAIEFRHPSCFLNSSLNQKIYDLLKAYNVSTVITDVAGRRDVLHSSLTTPQAMVRFVGNELHPSDFTRTTDWVNRIKEWIHQGLNEIYFFIHHPTYINVPELANDFINKLNPYLPTGLKRLDLTPISTQRDQQMSLL